MQRGTVALDGRSRLVRAVDSFDRKRLDRVLEGPLGKRGEGSRP